MMCQLADFYPRSPCGERRGKSPRRCVLFRISIHALLAESDVVDTLIFAGSMLFLSTLSLRRATEQTKALKIPPLRISIHALLAESDDDLEPSKTRRLTFLSTLSLRRATPCDVFTSTGIIAFLSTLSLRRATYMGVTVLGIQHHFYPRSPCGERRQSEQTNPVKISISIHALLAESDLHH